MLTTILYIYLTGFAVGESVAIYTFAFGKSHRVITKKEDLLFNTLLSAMWPIVVPFAIYNKIKN